MSVQNLQPLPSRQHRLQHPFPHLSAFLQNIGLHRQPGFEWQGLAIGLDALGVQADVDAVQRFFAARLGK